VLTLSHSNITPSLEHHHREGASWEGISDDQLSNDVETNLLIRDSLDHADRNNIEERDHESENEPLASRENQIRTQMGSDRQVTYTGNLVSQTSIEMTPKANMLPAKNEFDRNVIKGKPTILTEDNCIPPLGNLRVVCHQTGMDIRLLVHSTAGLSPYLLAVVQERVRKCGRDRSKRQSVGNGERSREKQRAVCLVCRLVEGSIRIDDFGNVVSASGVGVRDAGRNGHVLGVPHICVLDLR